MTDPLISVVVIAHNEEASLPGLLGALSHQTVGRSRFETLVVDDGSTDATAQIARDSGFANVLSTDGGLGDAARNVALRHARGDVIAITDADCRPEPDWLERGLEDLDRLGVDVIVGHIEVPLSERPSLAEMLDFSRFLDQERAVKEIGFGATANLILRRAVFDRVGLFNEHLFAGGDREFGMRAVEAGCGVTYSPRAVVHHPPSRTAAELMRRCYRGGYACAHLVRYGTGPAARNAHIVWLHPGAYRPSRIIYGVERLYANGHRPSWIERLRLGLGQWAYAQLPMVAGSFVGTVRGVRRARRSR